MQASPNLLHYTRLMSRYEAEVRKRQLDELFERQFPEHSSLVLANRAERSMHSLDGGIIRALSLATGADEQEVGVYFVNFVIIDSTIYFPSKIRSSACRR